MVVILELIEIVSVREVIAVIDEHRVTRRVVVSVVLNFIVPGLRIGLLVILNYALV
jgi:hypothetical protein